MRLLTTTILIGILYLFCSQIAQSAEMKVVDNSVFVNTDSYEVQFTDGIITHLYNKLTEETYTLPLGSGGVIGFRGRSGLLKRDGRSIWTDQATLTQAKKVAPLRARLVFNQGQNEIRLFITVNERTGDLLIEQKGFSDTAGVYGIQWGCVNLNTRDLDLILPADGGQIINAMAPVTFRDFHYPFSWEVQLAILQGEQGGFFVRGTDKTFQFKTLHYERDRKSFALGFETQNQAPFDALTSAKSVVWRLNTYTGDWRVPARQYRDWMERTFDPWRLDEIPAWVGEIGLVATYISPSLDIGILGKLADQVDPAKTLLYLNEWRKDDYDVNFPDYTAKPEFGRFVEAAHQHGFRVMLHVNLVGVSTYHPLYDAFQKFQFRDPWNGNPLGWQWDETELLTRHAFINLASSAFRKHFVQQLKKVWEEYRVDAFHLDVSSFVVNDVNGLIDGLNASQGNVLIHKELAEAMPDVVFGGESLHEVTFFRESFAQRWKNPPQWAPTRRSIPHPISAFLFSPYTLPYGYLGLPNPDRGLQLYQEYLESYEKWGVLPTLRLWSVEDLGPERVETQKLLSIARTWQEFGLKPDFETDWEADTLFQYIGKDGKTATLSTTDGGATFDLPLGEVGYERVFGVTQVKTYRSLPHWHAYNETKILGLDPRKSYLLSETPRDFSQVHINALPEGISVTESRVTENAALFRLERTDTSHEIDLLSELHIVRTGIVVNGQELPQQKGSTFRRTDASVSGVRKPAIDVHPPWQGLIGNTFGEWEFSLPESPHIRLEYDIGLQDGSENSDGVTFIVSVQGNEIFRQHHNAQRWKHISIDMTPYRGQRVKLRFTTTPGPKGNTGWDWARWGEPKIISGPSNELAKVGFFLPNAPIKSLPNTVKHQRNKQYSLETELPTQILFFFESRTEAAFPYNLRDTDFVIGLQSDGIFRRGSVWNSGQRMGLTLDGVSKETIFAHPPFDGQTVLQFLLSLPKAHELMFSFSMGLQDESCSDGLSFKVLLNGRQQFEHFTNTPGWTDAAISLSEFADETVLLELVTDSEENPNCDWAHWADLTITAEGGGLEAPNQMAGVNQGVTETKFLPNYPNPFNPETWIPYQLAEAAGVSVKIYDVGGHLVRTISVGFKPIGYYLTRERAAYWDGRNTVGESVSSGVYFLRFVAGDFSATQRIVVLK